MTQTSLGDLIVEAEENEELQIRSRIKLRDPLEKYTEAVMLKIHDAYPLAALSSIDYKQANSWGTEKEGKLLAQPFERSVLDPKNHSMIQLLILAAVVEIMKATKTTMGKLAMRTTSRKVPTTFLIYNLTEAQKTTLLKRSV